MIKIEQIFLIQHGLTKAAQERSIKNNRGKAISYNVNGFEIQIF